MRTETESKTDGIVTDEPSWHSIIAGEIRSCSLRFRVAAYTASCSINILLATYFLVSKGHSQANQMWGDFLFPTFWALLLSRFILFRMPKRMAYQALVALAIPWLSYATATIACGIAAVPIPNAAIDWPSIVSTVVIVGLGNVSMNYSPKNSVT
ncbi:MAG: hypothetical protein HGA31_05790 [Candidatus Moranbacteria bacterium]|nr:hypothetical protein [Candidatus Moranbacteria bacterium]